MLQKKFTIAASDCSASKEWKLSSFLKAVEEISIADVIRGGLTKDKTLERGLLWVISAMSFRFESYPKYDETAVLETFALPRMHRFFPRAYVLYGKDGRIIASGTALWCLIDAETRSSIDPTAYGIRILPAKKASDYHWDLSDFAFPRNMEKTQEETRTVRYSDLDLNGHMTNYRYADWFEDVFQEESGSLKDTESFRIAFHKEAVLGEPVRLSFGKEKPSVLSLEGFQGQSKIFEICLKKRA